MIVIDSYMAMILPDDIAERISGFIAGKRNFPFVGPDELMSIMYLYGRNSKIGKGRLMKSAALRSTLPPRWGRRSIFTVTAPQASLKQNTSGVNTSIENCNWLLKENYRMSKSE